MIVGKMSGVVEPQSFINGIFWQIDSINVGEVKDGFSQLYYDDDVLSVVVTEDDIRRIAEINTGIGMNVGGFRTALVLKHPEVIRLAKIHQALAKSHGFEVENSGVSRMVLPGWPVRIPRLILSNKKHKLTSYD